MVNPAMIPDLPVFLPADQENEVLMELAEEIADEFMDEIEDAYPGMMVSPAIKLPARERLQQFLMITEPEDFPMLQDPDAIEKIRAGAYQPPASEHWALLVAVPKYFNAERKDFLSLYEKYVVKGE